jgi:hypothetical protein
MTACLTAFCMLNLVHCICRLFVAPLCSSVFTQPVQMWRANSGRPLPAFSRPELVARQSPLQVQVALINPTFHLAFHLSSPIYLKSPSTMSSQQFNEKIHFLDISSKLPGTLPFPCTEQPLTPVRRLPPIMVPQYTQNPSPPQRHANPLHRTIRILSRHRTPP